MTWLLIHGGRVVYCGSYLGALDAAAARHLCERSFHPDRTELAPRLERGVMIVPEAMIHCVRRVA